MRNVLTAVVLGLGFLFGSPVNGTEASTRALLALPNAAQALSAYGGYVVFSQSDANQSDWKLMVWHAGRVSALPVTSRSIPFDADVGPDARGRPAVVYSHCTSDPTPYQLYPMPDWTFASGCRIYELSLLGGREQLVKRIYAFGSSDSTPSIWMGAIAFARISASRPNESRVMLWRPGRPIRELPGGTFPCMTGARFCPRPMDVQPQAWVSAMDLGPKVLAFSWALLGDNVLHREAFEMRVDPLGGGRSRLADSGNYSEACTGVSQIVGSPNAAGDQILYVVEDQDICFGDASTFQTFAPSVGRWHGASPATGVIGAAARDGANTYWIQVGLTPPPPPDQHKSINQGDCLPEHETCTLMLTNNLVLRQEPRRYKPSPPVE